MGFSRPTNFTVALTTMMICLILAQGAVCFFCPVQSHSQDGRMIFLSFHEQNTSFDTR